MTVKDLKTLLEGAPEDMDVLIPLNPVFDGFFISPCLEDSGINELNVGDEKYESSFLLVPCGFFEDENYNPELN